MSTYDAVIIGAGQAGGPLSSALAGAGWKTMLVEREAVGGTCINWGCTPTKTMISSARVAHLARRAGDYGVHTGSVSVNLAEVRQRKRDIVDSFRSSSRQAIEESEAELIFGEGRFTGPKTLEIALRAGGTRQVEADNIFINTGSRPRIPEIDGLDRVPYLDSTSIMELGTTPEHLVIIGGGYIALEFGQMFHRFGSRVTILQRGTQLMSREDEDVAEAMTDMLRDEGLDVWLEAETQAVTQDGEQLTLSVNTPQGEQTLHGSHLLIAAGRVPNTPALNLAAAGVETRRDAIQVNERLETNVPGIYALGDVKGGPAFTHISYDDFRVLRTNLLAEGQATISDRPVPYVLFTDPQLGRIGLSEGQAKDEGRNYRVAKMPMAYAARALEVDETTGLMKAVIDADSQQILGFAMLGIEGGEIMAVIEVAMLGGLPYTTLEQAVFAHPTLAESLNNLFGMIGDS